MFIFRLYDRFVRLSRDVAELKRMVTAMSATTDALQVQVTRNTNVMAELIPLIGGGSANDVAVQAATAELSATNDRAEAAVAAARPQV